MKNCLINKKNVLELIHQNKRQINKEALECLNNKFRTLIMKSCNNSGGKRTIALEDIAIIDLRVSI
uniref:Uncharacterized protein n=1 Tax=viral metagenome TaxID=1070528 RepID=A0A6M3JGQ4_9ZZZZ